MGHARLDIAVPPQGKPAIAAHISPFFPTHPFSQHVRSSQHISLPSISSPPRTYSLPFTSFNSSRWCGLGADFCAAPYAQFNYGSGADTLQVPPGPATPGVARTKLGTIAYGGVGIYDCVEPGVIALTFDDGPYIYTSKVLDVLEQYNATATFFISGNNNGKVSPLLCLQCPANHCRAS
jgi:hypothetical protein